MALHVMVIVAAGALVLVISWDTFHSMSFIADPFYEKVQTWICCFFLLDIAAEWMLSERKWHYLWVNMFFILVSIPYGYIISHCHLVVSGPVMFALRFAPIIRAAYVIGRLVGEVDRNKATSMFTTYVCLLVAVLYFGSMMFFIAEQPVNPGVHSYWDALWWGIMDMTTCGSSISEMTPTGQIMGVVLAAGGLVLFPVFTVYVAAAIAGKSPATADDA